MISSDGKVQKARWEYLGNKSILIDKKEESYLFKHGFFDEHILALKRDNSSDYTLFVNENKFDGEIDSLPKVIEFLSLKYLMDGEKKTIKEQTGVMIGSSPIQIPDYSGQKDSEAWVVIVVIIIFLFAFFTVVTSV